MTSTSPHCEANPGIGAFRASLGMLSAVSVRRVVLSLLVVLALGSFWLAGHVGKSGDVEPSIADSAVESLLPSDGSPNVLRQTEIGIDLTDGWVASLAINGHDIPDDQLR